jgi:hypothetical protein
MEDVFFKGAIPIWTSILRFHGYIAAQELVLNTINEDNRPGPMRQPATVEDFKLL